MDAFTISAPLSGWVTPLSNVPDPVFAERMVGDGVAIDPTGDTLFAPCDAEVLTVHDARHALSLRCDNGAELILHLGIDTVALRGEGIEARVRPGQRMRTGDPLLKFDLDLLVQRAAAVVTPIIVCGAFSVEVLARGLVSPGDALLRIEPTNEATEGRDGGLSRRDVTVALPHGIHARPAARIVDALRGLEAAAFLVVGEKSASASSPVAMLGLGAGHGMTIAIQASGRDAEAAIDAIAAVLGNASAQPEPERIARAPVVDGPGLAGVPAAPGLAIGPAFWLRSQAAEIDGRSDDPRVEREKLDATLAQARADMRAAADQPGAGGAIIGAQLALLDDPVLTEAAYAAISSGLNAAGAWRRATQAQTAILAASADQRIAARAEDLRDIENRVLATLLPAQHLDPQVPPGGILLAEELLPSQIIKLDATKVAGVALVRGGPTSHAAILAAGMALPMAVGFGRQLEAVGDGTKLILDADSGRLEVDPPSDRLTKARSKQKRRSAAAAAARETRHALCHTRDGTRVEVFANLGSLADARTAVDEGAEGCGLLRTEFLFLNRETPPSEAEQTSEYQAIADALGDRPLIVRLLDIGGDKPAAYLNLPAEENPALGVRGIRVGLADEDLLETQISAILAVKPNGRCRIMAPMVANLSELNAVAAMIERLGGGAELGVMVETPAAAMTADLLARRASFLSIGSNDLAQYTLAMDRGNAAVAAGLDGLHPAVLRLIARTCEGARKHDTLVAVCGGLAADPLAVPILVGLGVRELSVPPASIAAIKALVSHLTVSACESLATQALALDSAAAVRAVVSDFEGARP